MTSIPTNRFKLVSGDKVLTRYKWNTMVAEHYFCSICGIYTHHRRRLDPGEYGFNVACLEEIEPESLENITVFDGKSLSLE